MDGASRARVRGVVGRDGSAGGGVLRAVASTRRGPRRAFEVMGALLCRRGDARRDPPRRGAHRRGSSAFARRRRRRGRQPGGDQPEIRGEFHGGRSTSRRVQSRGFVVRHVLASRRRGHRRRRARHELDRARVERRTRRAGGGVDARRGARARVRRGPRETRRGVPRGVIRDDFETRVAPRVFARSRASWTPRQHPALVSPRRAVQVQRRRGAGGVAGVVSRRGRRAPAPRADGVQAVPLAGTHPRVRFPRLKSRRGSARRRATVSPGGRFGRAARRRLRRRRREVPRDEPRRENAQRSRRARRRDETRRRTPGGLVPPRPRGRGGRPPRQHTRTLVRAADALPRAETRFRGDAGRGDGGVAREATREDRLGSRREELPRRIARARRRRRRRGRGRARRDAPRRGDGGPRDWARGGEERAKRARDETASMGARRRLVRRRRGERSLRLLRRRRGVVRARPRVRAEARVASKRSEGAA